MPFNKFLSNVNSKLNTINSAVNRVGSAVNSINEFRSSIKSTVQDFSNPASFMSDIRRKSLPIGAEYSETIQSYGSSSFSPQTGGDDWRVRIHLPDISSYTYSQILSPLVRSNKSMVFPATPQVLVQHSANYNNLAPTHTNYSFPVYQNSSVEDITLTCEWPVENEADGLYWIASVHFLRSITKMFYGNSPNRGAPPPIAYLSGYGDFIFNKIPIVVKMFTMDLNEGVDYIKVPIDRSIEINEGPEFYTEAASGSFSYVPILGRISVVVQPVYSRDETRQFNLDEFIRGNYIGNGSTQGGPKGFI